MLLDLSNVHAGYGRAEVLHGVDLRVPDGNVVALLGANGAGKTTLLKTVAGLLRPTRGTIRWQGAAIETTSPHERVKSGICLIPEGRGVFRRLSVRENLAMQVRGKRVGLAVEQATAAFPVLGRRLGQLAGTLSGGEQQMLALSRALVSGAKLVLADELSVGLAPVVVDEIFDVVNGLRTQGCSLLIVEQYVERAVEIADYVYILQKGTVAFVGEPEQCLAGPIFDRYLGTG
ncbi:MAG TPA: ABC transporter ATP-binding protein [Acidimicrobiales bacterium]|jgi:branched-chain amino acid transport system ATP-binding protein|nr:ABC transporter ATP-binding protein [Acidimicrobiales bacterium]